ncbi:MAG: FAD-binding and (Fe-S)-binding domain-containing protein [Bacteroidales bacterium]
MAQDSFEIRKDKLTKILYSTDASAYREEPLGVCFPETKQEIADIIKFAAREKISIIPRAAGTSLAGQVVGSGLVVDISRNFKRIIEINAGQRWARVEPGVVLDELNLECSKYGLFFGPETSTSNRCMIAGMVGNNSCGSHSLVYGSTRDHLLECEVVLSDGSVTVFKSLTPAELDEKLKIDGVEGDIYRYLKRLFADERFLSEVSENFPDPKVRRRNTGYALDELLSSDFNLCKLLAGSEGTLAFITEVKLNLVPLPPKHKALLCAHCKTLDKAFEANLIALDNKPVAVELMDSNILELSKSNINQNKNRFFISGEPAAILITEFVAETPDSLTQILESAERELLESGHVYHCSKVKGDDIAKVWELRKSGLGLLTTMAGDAKPVSVIEDTAVAPYRLPSYMEDFGRLMDRHGLKCVYHAHIGTGELHLRPILNLKDSKDVSLFREVAKETALLVKKHRGSLSGEHGDGRLRGEFIPLMYGDYLYGVMKEVKQIFDRPSIFNSGKIVDTPPMNTMLRYFPDEPVKEYNTYFDYSEKGGWLRAVEQCNGSGDCRKSISFPGTMCPSFRVSGREEDSTRGRANVLRELLTNPKSGKVFDQREILDVLDLCISCKACKSECPSNIDMARYKSEFLQHHYDVCGYSFRSFMVSRMAQMQKLGSFIPGIYNYFATNRISSSFLKKILKFSSNRSIPQLSKVTLRRYAARRFRESTFNSGMFSKRLYLFADEFTNFNEAEVGIAFIELMHRLGYEVIIPKHFESGRAAISKGMLKRAKMLANKNVEVLKDIITDDCPLVGIEPSAILSFRDEYPSLVNESLRESAKKLAGRALLYDEFIMREFEKGNIDKSLFNSNHLKIKLHGHCHQKSLASVELSAKMLSIPANYKVETLPTGCCGMAGSFGYEKEHYDFSMKIGEQMLFPLVRDSWESVEISAPGTSCRQQILDGTGRKAKHPIQILNEALR